MNSSTDPPGAPPPARSPNVVWSAPALSRGQRCAGLGVRGGTVWFTGLSGSGKSTIAAALEAALVGLRVPAYRLDGDNVRHGLCADLGFSATDRHENIRRVGEVARLMADAGLVVLVSFISPYRADRERVRAAHAAVPGAAGAGAPSGAAAEALPFFEVFVDAPLAVCEGRDPKGLYKKARAGELRQFTGIDDPYEAPERPDLVLKTAEMSIEDSVAACVGMLRAAGLVRRA